ncbi:FAD-NAD(P)-binding [Nonomuraea solani]|uniref:FAD-NAD(P)-binding n=1 Tax=Nonomuraea solani TaxID=1144553 RepID=A0A1H6EXP2_9ACTN|nr:FAD/NAD(P)-binding protein [Nonomuraea solani]SEH02650.1 FAD-NAD(P)-binding [Nonomuraea solani]
MSAVVVVGAGPSGTSLVERICANARIGGGRVLDLHVVDPYPPGGGRLWRSGQSDALRAGSAAEELTVFRDGEGPSLADWLGGGPGQPASRSQVGEYLRYAFERTVRLAPRDVRVRVHEARAVGLTGAAGRQRVALSTGGSLEADAVVLAHGRPKAPPPTAEIAFADRHGLTYLTADRHGLAYASADRPAGPHGPAYLTDGLDLDAVPAGRPVLVRGTGRSFADLVALLTVGRGGRFIEGRRGEPVYRPSGAEPLLYAGSRHGVPHHARPGYRLAGPPPSVDGHAEAKGLAYAYYHELFTRHSTRTRTTWQAFESAFEAAEWGGKEMRALITKAVPRFADRLRLDRLERPLHGMRFGDLAGLQRWMHGYLAADLERGADPAFSADLAMIHWLLSARTVRADDPWLQGLAGLLADGPSLARQAELRALARAGVVTFLGADLRVRQDEESGMWRATSPTVPGSTVARTLVEADPPGGSDPLIAGLYARGECRETAGLLDVRLPDRRLVSRTGAAHGRRFALGSWTLGGAAGFDSPGGPAELLRQADALSRTVLAQVAGSWLHAAA